MPFRNNSTGQFEPLQDSAGDPNSTNAAYGPPAVAKYRLRKEIRDADLNRGARAAGAAGLAGAAAGALASGGTIKSRAIRSLLGGAAGVAGVGAIRAATAPKRDEYGDRPRSAKAAEAVPAIAGLGLAGALAAAKLRGKFFAVKPQERKPIPGAVKAGISAAASGAMLGLIPAFRRGVGLKSVLKSVAGGAAAGAAVGGGGTYIGEKIIGAPRPGEGAPITKRAALGGALVGAGAGVAAGILGHKTRVGRSILGSAAKGLRPALWAKKSGTLGAAAVGGLAGAAVGGFHAADEGQQVDTLNAMKADRLKKAGTGRSISLPVSFEAALAGHRTLGLSEGQAVMLAAEQDREGYLRHLAARGIVRRF